MLFVYAMRFLHTLRWEKDWFGGSVPPQPAHSPHPIAFSFPRRRPFIPFKITLNREFIRSRTCVQMSFTAAEGSPGTGPVVPQGSFSNGCCLLFWYHHGQINVRLSLFSHSLNIIFVYSSRLADNMKKTRTKSPCLQNMTSGTMCCTTVVWCLGYSTSGDEQIALASFAHLIVAFVALRSFPHVALCQRDLSVLALMVTYILLLFLRCGCFD